VNLSCVVGADVLEINELTIGNPAWGPAITLREGNFGAASEIKFPKLGQLPVGGVAAQSDRRAVGRNGGSGEKHLRGEFRDGFGFALETLFARGVRRKMRGQKF
jgi:hypothetical protein